MNKYKPKGRSFTVISSSVILLSILTLLVFAVLYSTVYTKIDFSLDESLFLSQQRGNITRFYYDAIPGDSEYTPCELSATFPSENKKVWYSYENIGDNVKEAFISAEDRRFFLHRGVDIS